MEMSVPYESQQNLCCANTKIFGKKLIVFILCTIINTSPDDVILPKNKHIGEMKPLSNTDDS